MILAYFGAPQFVWIRFVFSSWEEALGETRNNPMYWDLHDTDDLITEWDEKYEARGHHQGDQLDLFLTGECNGK